MKRSLVVGEAEAQKNHRSSMRVEKKKVEEFGLNADEIRERLSRDFPLGLVPRSEIEKATGGIYTPKTMANKDQDGSGIKEHVRLNKKICYPFDALIDFLLESGQKIVFEGHAAQD